MVPSGSSAIKKHVSSKALYVLEEASPFCDPLTESTFKYAKMVISKSESFAIVGANHLLSLPKSSFFGVFNDTVYEEVSSVILNIIRDSWNYAHTTLKILEKMESVVAPEELLKIVSNEFYMTPPRSCTVYYVARKLINDCFIPKENETEEEKKERLKLMREKSIEIGNLSNEPVIREALLCEDKEKALLMILAHNYID